MVKERKNKQVLTVLILLIVSFIIVLVLYYSIGKIPENKNDDLEKIFCEDSDRDADFCIELYKPVCGWNDPEKIQCIKYPCATTYSNSCFACQNEDVLYWTEGECPSG